MISSMGKKLNSIFRSSYQRSGFPVIPCLFGFLRRHVFLILLLGLLPSAMVALFLMSSANTYKVIMSAHYIDKQLPAFIALKSGPNRSFSSMETAFLDSQRDQEFLKILAKKQKNSAQDQVAKGLLDRFLAGIRWPSLRNREVVVAGQNIEIESIKETSTLILECFSRDLKKAYYLCDTFFEEFSRQQLQVELEFLNQVIGNLEFYLTTNKVNRGFTSSLVERRVSQPSDAYLPISDSEAQKLLDQEKKLYSLVKWEWGFSGDLDRPIAVRQHDFIRENNSLEREEQLLNIEKTLEAAGILNLTQAQILNDASLKSYTRAAESLERYKLTKDFILRQLAAPELASIGFSSPVVVGETDDTALIVSMAFCLVFFLCVFIIALFRDFFSGKAFDAWRVSKRLGSPERVHFSKVDLETLGNSSITELASTFSINSPAIRMASEYGLFLKYRKVVSRFWRNNSRSCLFITLGDSPVVKQGLKNIFRMYCLERNESHLVIDLNNRAPLFVADTGYGDAYDFLEGKLTWKEVKRREDSKIRLDHLPVAKAAAFRSLPGAGLEKWLPIIKKKYGRVSIHAPEHGYWQEISFLAKHCDQVVVVVPLGMTLWQEVDFVKDHLPAENLAGVVTFDAFGVV